MILDPLSLESETSTSELGSDTLQQLQTLEDNTSKSKLNSDTLERFRTLVGMIMIKSSKSSKLAENTKEKKWWRCEFLDLMSSLLLAGFIASLIFGCYDHKTCPSNYNKFLPFRGQCYQISNKAQTWSEAISICKKDGGFLLELYTETEFGTCEEDFEFYPKKP